jgi:hypothetical protein
MRIEEVTNHRLANEFLEVPTLIYKHDQNYIRPLDDDINKVFDKEKNKYFKHGILCRWVLFDDKENAIGRVAAFINDSTAYKFDQPTGGMGFFECINNQDAANLLLDTCKHWLAAHNMEAMDGPINFGERNNWWGLLIEGFDPPSYGMNYHMPYYRTLLENYGFQLYFNQLTYGLGVNDERPEIYYAKSKKLLAEDPNYHFKHINFKEAEKFTEDFRTIYNKAFVNSREGLKEMSSEQAQNLMHAMKPILVDYLVWFGYYKEDPIAIFFMMPELNGYFKHVNGKMNLLGKLKFLYHKYTGSVRKMYGIMFGVVPEHQGKGVEGGIIMGANAVVQPKKRWDDMELTWIGDFNPKMMKVAENLGAVVVKKHATFRYLFDRTKPFERYPMID